MEQKLLNFDGFSMKMEEDGAAAPAASGLTSLGDVQGMGAPVLASRGVTGSGDVASPPAKKKSKKKSSKKKSRRVETFDDFDY